MRKNIPIVDNESDLRWVNTSDLEWDDLLQLNYGVDYIQKSFDNDGFLARFDYRLDRNKIEIEKEIKNSRSMLVTIPYGDYDNITSDIVSQIDSKRVCYVILNKTYDSLMKFLERKKISTANMTFVDCITRTIINAEKRKHCYFVSSPGALDELAKTTSGLLIQNFDYLIFDSLSDLLTYKDVDEVEQFVKNITDILIENRCKSIFYAVSRRRFVKENPSSEMMDLEKSHKERDSLIEEQIISIDKVVDLRVNKNSEDF